MTKKYKLKNTNLYHNGKFVAVGSIIELNEDDAKKLSDVELLFLMDIYIL